METFSWDDMKKLLNDYINSMDYLSKIKNQQHYQWKRCILKNINALSIDLWIVCVGCKCSFLYDYGNLELFQALDLMHYLNKCLPFNNPIKIIVLYNQIFFIHVSNLMSKLETDIGNNFQQIEFIDISSHHSTPIQKKKTDLYLQSFYQVYQVLVNSFINPPSCEYCTIFFNHKNVCVVSIAGWFLNYPILYYLTTETNCLDHHSLYQCEVNASFDSKSFVLYSFTFPKNILCLQHEQKIILSLNSIIHSINKILMIHFKAKQKKKNDKNRLLIQKNIQSVCYDRICI